MSPRRRTAGWGWGRRSFLQTRVGEAAEVGRRGEAAAAHWLWWRGYRILGRNVTTELGELDIIAERHGVVVFVEVKTRTRQAEGDGAPGDEAPGVAPGSIHEALILGGAERRAARAKARAERDPLEAVDRGKRRKLRAVAASWLRRYEPNDVPHRFDAIAVEHTPRGRFRVIRHERDILDHVPSRALAVTAPLNADAALRAALADVGPHDDELLDE
jgi:Holliday junction resolvase-like predicted endonuclease